MGRTWLINGKERGRDNEEPRVGAQAIGECHPHYRRNGRRG